MLRVGLTGGIGSGKSAVADRFAALGAVVLDGDKAARAIVEPGTPGLARIAETFGADVLRADGSLDRAKLAGIVFSDEAARAKLNAITHPLIHEHIQAAEEAAVAAGGPGTIVVHDIPLLAEGQRAADFAVVIVVDVPPEVQVARLAGRGLPADQARSRMAAQATREQRLAIADIVIDNSGTLNDLDRRVAEVWDELRSRVERLRARRADKRHARLPAVSVSSRRVHGRNAGGRGSRRSCDGSHRRKGLSMMGRSGGYRGLARGLAVTGTIGAAVLTMTMTGCSVQGPAAPGHPTASHPATGHPTTTHPTTGTPTALPRASCGQATTHQLSGATQFFQADKGALSCFATAARQCQSASIAVTEMGVDTGTKYVFAIAPGKSNCPATEWSQGYSANFGGSKHFKVVATQCSAASRPDGVLLGCGRQDILIPVKVTT